MTKPLSTLDAAFLRMETPRTPMHVAGLLVFRLPAHAPRDFLRDLVERAREPTAIAAPFNFRLAAGRLDTVSPSWEIDECFDIDDHLRHVILPRPGGERELARYIGREHQRPLDFSRSLWEFHVIEGLEQRRFAIYFKVHHALMDGIASLRHISRWLSPDPAGHNTAGPWADTGNGVAAAPPSDSTAQRKPLWHRSIERISDQLHSAAELTQTLIRMSNRQENPAGGVYSALEAPHVGMNAAVTAKRRFAAQLLPLDRVKQVAATTGTSVNDVVLAIVSGALRNYLLELDELPDKTLVASIPVGLPRPDGRDGNVVTGFVCPLATQEAEAGRRLQLIHEVTLRTKEQLRSLPMTALWQLAMLGMSPMILGQMTGLASRLPPFFNLIVSNVPGPRQKMYLHGAELLAMYPVSILMDGHALNISVVGYDRQLAFGLTACPDAVPHAQRIALNAVEAFYEIERATQQPTTIRRMRRRTVAVGSA